MSRNILLPTDIAIDSSTHLPRCTALRQVNDHVEQQGHDGQLWVLTDNSPDAYW